MPTPQEPERGVTFDLISLAGELRRQDAYAREGHTARTMAAHLRGHLVAAPRSDRLRTATRARWSQAREGLGASLLVDGTSDVGPSATVASAVEHAVRDDASGPAHA